MEIIAVKGVSQVGKSNLVRGLIAGAAGRDINMEHVEFSDAMVGIANRALAHDAVSAEQLERNLLRMLAMTIDHDLPTVMPPERLGDDERIKWDILRRDLQDWYRTVPPNFQLTDENKDRNRIILTWLALYGRRVADNEAVFTRPVLRAVERAQAAGDSHICIGGMRFPGELMTLELDHYVTVIEVKSARRPEDHDLANARRNEIEANTIFYANFATPEASFECARDELWPDLLKGDPKPHYGTAA